jgi:hypothetical protein
MPSAFVVRLVHPLCLLDRVGYVPVHLCSAFAFPCRGAGLGGVVQSRARGTCHVVCLLARRVVFRPPASRTILLKGFVDSAGRGQLRPRRPAALGRCREGGIRLHQLPTPSGRRVVQRARPLRRPGYPPRVCNKTDRCGVLESSDRLFQPRFLAFLGSSKQSVDEADTIFEKGQICRIRGATWTSRATHKRAIFATS